MKNFFSALILFIWLSVITGILYPLAITLIAQTTMKEKAEGQLVQYQKRIVGSALIGQKFTSENYFWGRPSAIDYNPLPSGGSNLSPTSADLQKQVKERSAPWKDTAEALKTTIPSELLFASGSGLDPHITAEAAVFQVDRIAKSRGFKTADEKEKLLQLIHKHSFATPLNLYGKPYVNVLLLNIALDEEFTKHE